MSVILTMSIKMAALSKLRTVFDHSDVEIMDWIPTRGIDLHSFYICVNLSYAARGLETMQIPSPKKS
jgi:hypothetical protein